MASDFEVLLIAFLVAIIAGWVDTISGGGGLISLPALILLGLPPAAALATNKLQGSSGTLCASWHFIKNGTIRVRSVLRILLTIFIGATLGTYLILKIGNAYLIKFLPFLLLAIGIYVLVAKNLDDVTRKSRISLRTFTLIPAPFLGFYDGFFGPGTGSFMILALARLRGKGLSEATAYAKLFNFVSNFSSLCYFVAFGTVYWYLGAVMIVGQIIGASVGVHVVVKKGSRVIKPMVVLTCFAMAFRMFFLTI